MRLFIYLIPFTIAILLNSCCGDCQSKYYNAPMYISSPIIKQNNKLYFQYYSQQNNQGEYKPSKYNMNKSYLYEFNNSNHKWVKIASKIDKDITLLNDYDETIIQDLYKPFDRYSTDKMLISDDYYVAIEQNIAKIKQLSTDNLVDKYELASLDEIISNLDILYNKFEKIEYYPIFNHTYDPLKKDFIVFLSFDKQKVQAGDKYNCYYVKISFQNGSWNYKIIKQVELLNVYKDRNSLTQNIFLDFKDGNISVSYYAPNDNFIIMQDGNLSFAQSSEKSFNKDFYKKVLLNIYSFDSDEHYNGSYGVPTFDEKGNMHLFYNKKEDIKNENYKYFWYGYFTKDNPKTPLYEQKILWE